MEFNYAYSGNSSVNNTGSGTDVSFAPDTKREPTFFRGNLQKSLEFREAISSLHDVVISDLRWKPRDRSEYEAWRKQQDEVDWALVAAQQADIATKIEEISVELNDLRARSKKRRGAFNSARQKYFNYLYRQDRDAWIVLDPVITVHPDEVFFECFSQDESSYGRLSVGYEVFKDVGEFSCGTTNVDYSAALYDEFQKIRSYKNTQFEIDPSGFDVQTAGEVAYKEVKIDLPDTWVRGFLQVSSAMSLPMVSFQLHPMDVHNICFILRRNKELKGPRSIRYILKPGEPVKIVFDPLIMLSQVTTRSSTRRQQSLAAVSFCGATSFCIVSATLRNNFGQDLAADISQLPKSKNRQRQLTARRLLLARSSIYLHPLFQEARARTKLCLDSCTGNLKWHRALIPRRQRGWR